MSILVFYQVFLVCCLVIVCVNINPFHFPKTQFSPIQKSRLQHVNVGFCQLQATCAGTQDA